MSGFVGWRLRESRPVNLERILACWHVGEKSSASTLPANQGLVWNRTRDPISIVVLDEAWAVIDGRPRWLDAELAQQAHKSGDAAAALAAYNSFGPHLLEKLSGSYALVLADQKSDVTVMAVDRFATRPLAFCSVDDDLIFGSTVEGLRRHTRVSAQIDLQSVYSYFFFHVIPSPQTIYRNITKLEPGQVVVHSPSGIQRRFHWSPDFSSAASNDSTRDLHVALPAALESAILKCKPKPGFGAYLSGGLDSSAVAGFLSKTLNAPTPAYCVGFEQAGYDEMEYARIAATHFGLALREIYATPENVAQVFAKVASYYDEPFGNSSAVPAYLCARRAAEDNVHHLLAGDGGDELFGGNERYVRQKVFEYYWHLPQWWRDRILRPLFQDSDWSAQIPLLRKIGSYVKQASMPMPDRTQSYNLLHRLQPDAIFESGFLEEVDTADPLQLLRSRYEDADTDSLLSKMLYLDWKFTLADNDLRKVNGSAALADVSVMYPMLDEEVVDLSLKVPDRQKIVGNNLRKFYKDALSNFLPAQVLTKKKHGFGLPFGEWLNKSQELRSTILDSLSSLREHKLVRKDFLDGLIEQHRQEHAAYYGGAIWVFAMFSRWLTEHEIRI